MREQTCQSSCDEVACRISYLLKWDIFSLNQVYHLMCFRQGRQTRGCIILPDFDVELAVSFNGNGVGENGKLRSTGSNIAIAGDLEWLCWKIEYTIEIHCSAANDQILFVGN